MTQILPEKAMAQTSKEAGDETKKINQNPEVGGIEDYKLPEKWENLTINWALSDPAGKIYNIKNLRRFCIENSALWKKTDETEEQAAIKAKRAFCMMGCPSVRMKRFRGWSVVSKGKGENVKQLPGYTRGWPKKESI